MPRRYQFARFVRRPPYGGWRVECAIAIRAVLQQSIARLSMFLSSFRARVPQKRTHARIPLP
eukprot:8911482-Lingulodinium_polyedra.AAC.1